MKHFMELLFSLLFALLCFASCASPSHTVDPYPSVSEPQHSTEAYQAADGSVQPATGSDAAATAGAAIVDQALFSKAHGSKKGDYGKNSISGHCALVGSDGTEAPCTSLVIFLKDQDGKVVFQRRTNSFGDFSFSVKEAKTYFLEIQSTKIKATFDPAGPFTSGAQVQIKASTF